jgi:type I restriction enzyme, R subunit
MALTELLAQPVASDVGRFSTPEEKQVDLLRRLLCHGIVPREVEASE